MMSLDLSLFDADDLDRLLADLEATLRTVVGTIAALPNHEVPASRLIYIAELEAKRARYCQRLTELGRPPSSADDGAQRRSVGRRDIASVGPPADAQTVAYDAARAVERERLAARYHAAPDAGPRPHLILFLAANPHATSRLELGEECAQIQRELQMARHRDDFRFESRWAVSIDELMRHLQELDPAVIHFSGHGGNTGLILQDEQGRPQPVSTRALAMMIQATALSARVVVLNACYTTGQADALREAVDCVVGMNGAIGDAAARAFAVRFYGALGNRRSIANAVASGVAALAARQLPDELLPRCVTRRGVAADQVVLSP